VRDLKTNNGTGAVSVSGHLQRTTKDLDGKLDAHDVALASLAPEIRGTAAATAVFAKRGGSWSGDGHVHVAQLVLPNRPAVDVDTDVHVARRRVTVKGGATSAVGSATFLADVDGPSDLIDVPAWKALDRRAVRELEVEVAHLDAV
jgi:hypothetical protein